MKDKLKIFLSWFYLRSELESYDVIHENIEKGIVFKGTNLWILVFAIVVASVGLNMNSTAVIIGAMLISPLMGPINGLGYSLATYDFHLFRLSAKNFSFALGISLITSTLYFVITPINQAHSELLARTSPTIYDVIIAFFGGLAGMIAMSSKLKGNVIPGVAIATALMPPICTAGYGLATLQFNFFFGALYLFTINSVFIAFAALIVCQFLKFPIRSIVDPDRRRRVNHAITIIIILTIIPSIFFGVRLVQNQKFVDKSESFLHDVAVVEANYLQNQKIRIPSKTVELVYSGYGLSDSTRNFIKQRALNFGLDSSKVIISQAFGFDIIQDNVRKFQSQTEILNNKLNAALFTIRQKDNKIDSIMNIPMLGQKIIDEIKPIYPQIQNVAYFETYFFTNIQDSITRSDKIPTIIFTARQNSLNRSDRSKIENWVKKRIGNENSKILFEYIN
jgi:uncharacterized hydrophobic protein (TIGR00271 family)